LLDIFLLFWNGNSKINNEQFGSNTTNLFGPIPDRIVRGKTSSDVGVVSSFKSMKPDISKDIKLYGQPLNIVEKIRNIFAICREKVQIYSKTNLMTPIMI
jgi:hypothetical protein